MKKTKLPRSDSIRKLAEYWDSHDLTDFDEELVEVTEPVFVRDVPLQINLHSSEAAAVKQLAEAKGVSQEELVRTWVLRQLANSNGDGAKKPGR